MSEITDFYLSWQATNAFGAAGVRLRDQEPIVFKPTDISGCALWMDGNDNDAVVYNSFLEVTAWKNKGTLGGQFDISGTQAVQYGTTQVNGLNTVTFTANSFMSGTFAFDFQARSVFFVTKENTDVSGGIPNPWLSSDTNGGMETFSLRNGAFTYFLGKHPSPIPEEAFETPTDYLGVPTMVEFINATDISNNWFGINGTKYPAVYESAASGYNTNSIIYFLGGYFGGSTIPSNEDVCEILIYNTALSEPDRINVEDYLRRKWNLAEPTPPPPPPPVPFSPLDIAGCYIWMDANNLSTLTLGGSNEVLGWSNLGLASNSFSNECNYATSAQDSNSKYFVAMPSVTTLATYAQLPYYTRTNFVVWENVSDLSLLTYPYENLWSCGTAGGVQMGAAYDSNTGRTYMSMCQQGYNCPCVGEISLPVGGYNLSIMGLDSNTVVKNAVYFNGGSNINIGTDLGNLFNTSPIPYGIGSPVSDSPSFRLGEIIEYDSLLNSAQLSTVANYLVTKWSISSFTPLV